MVLTRSLGNGAAVVSALVLLSGCQDRLPTAPSEVTTGLVIYEHANFVGASALITRDIRDLKDFRGPCERYESSGSGSVSVDRSWDDCISSIRVAPGWRATVYRHDDFRGESLDLDADVSNLQLVAGDCDEGMNDCITSIRVVRP